LPVTVLSSSAGLSDISLSHRFHDRSLKDERDSPNCAGIQGFREKPRADRAGARADHGPFGNPPKETNQAS
jgi:hypothetical protein